MHLIYRKKELLQLTLVFPNCWDSVVRFPLIAVSISMFRSVLDCTPCQGAIDGPVLIVPSSESSLDVWTSHADVRIGDPMGVGVNMDVLMVDK